MANGRPEDHPFTDIVIHKREAIGPEVTRLVLAIEEFMDPRLSNVVRDLLWFMRPELANESWRPMIREQLERDLRELLDVAREIKRK